MLINGAISVKAQDSALWLKFRNITDLPDCNTGQCLHSDTSFQSVLSDIGAYSISLALPKIVDFPQASQYGLDLVYTLKFTGDETAAIIKLNSLSLLEYVDQLEDGEELSLPNDYNLLDGQWGANWQLDMIEALDAWSLSKDLHHIRISINEHGAISAEHEDIQGNLVVNPNAGAVNFHKTFVAGCASARTNNGVGISAIGYNAKLLDYGQSIPGMQPQESFVNGILEATAAGAHVINISQRWSCTFDETTQNAINMLTDMGVIIVAAAGNGDIGNSCNQHNYLYPASYDNVISVSSVGEDNRHFNSDPLALGTHTHNDKVDICAPGYLVLSTALGNDYGRSTGTSMAAPIVAGVVGLLLNINPCLSFDDILQIIQDTAEPIDDANDFPPNSLGAGRINAAQACLLAMQTVDIDQNNNIVSQNETWSGIYTVGQDLHIESGATLTLTGTLKMSPGKRIFVKQGARLLVNGGTITNSDCGNHFWQGIEVWGSTNEPQDPSTHGYLQLVNGAKIENAAQGVINWKHNDWNSRGGVIQAFESDFINNRRSVAFMQFENIDENVLHPDRSYFSGCNFKNNDDHIIPATELTPLAMVTLWDVHGVRFGGCTFENTMTASEFSQLSHGILSSDASYVVTYDCSGEITPGPDHPFDCPTLKRSVFEGFAVGLEATNSGNNAAPGVSFTDFSKNMLGIHFNGADYGRAIENRFYMGDMDFAGTFPDDASYHLGIRATKAYHYTIEQNEFKRDANSGNWATHGVLIDNCGTQSLQLYGNDFENLEAAIVAVGENGDGLSGLKFICNNNTNNNGDFEVRPDLFTNVTSRVSSYQSGDAQSSFAMGNTFSPGDGFNTNFVHFDFTSPSHYHFWYDPNAADQTPDTDEINVTPGTYALYEAQSSNACQETLSGVFLRLNVDDEKTEFYTVKNEYYNLKYVYEQLIDNGSTTSFMSDVVMNWSSDAWTYRDQLLAYAPNLSAEALIDVADRNLLPHGMLLEVLVANPDGLTSGHVIQHVACCIANPLPNHMIEILESANSIQTARTNTERMLGSLQLEMGSLQRNILMHYTLDSVAVHKDTLQTWYAALNTLEGRYSKTVEHLRRNEFSSATATLNDAELELRLSTAQAEAIVAMKSYVNFLSDLDGDGRSISELTETELDDLRSLASDPKNGTAGKRSENILCFFYGECTDHQGVPKNMNTVRKEPAKPFHASMTKEVRMECYPNPAKEFTQVDFELSERYADLSMRLYDLKGRLIEQWNLGGQQKGIKVIDSGSLVSGVYFIELRSAGNKLGSEKLIVQ